MAELKRLANLKVEFGMEEKIWSELREKEGLEQWGPLPPKLKKIAEEKTERKMNELRLWFWKRGIVMIRINGTC